MKKILKVEVEKIPTTTYSYNYRYTDNKEVTVRVEGFETLEDLEKDVKAKVRKLSNEDYKLTVVEKKS